MDTSKPLLATTIAPDYAMWSDWAMRARWFWFAALLRDYRPIARTSQHVLWLRDATAPRSEAPGQCRIVPQRINRVAIDLAGPTAPAGWIGLAAIDYASETRARGIETPARTLVTVSETSGTVEPPPIPPERRFLYGLPPQGQSVIVPFVPAGLGPARLTLDSLPHRASALSVRACSVHYVDYRPYAALPNIGDGALVAAALGRIACAPNQRSH